MIVLVGDKFEDVGLNGLKELNMTTLYEPNLQGPELAARIQESGAEILIVRGTKVAAECFAGSKLQLVIRAGAGYNTIDCDAAAQNGTYVCNCPGKNAIAVAELAWGLILACDRRIAEGAQQLREGKWNKKEFSKAQGLFGRTIGLVSLGSIGQAMIPIAKAFGLRVLVFSRHLSGDDAAKLGVERVSTLEELAQRSSIISVHSALNADTRGSLGASFFAAIQPGTIFVNTSRAEVVDESAMIEAVTSGKICAGLDVFDSEPSEGTGVYNGPLKDLPNVICTHHIGASTEQAQLAVAEETLRIVAEFAKSGQALNAVNKPVTPVS